MPWGDPELGGGGVAVRSVEAAEVAARAVAVRLADGTVKAWGDPEWGAICAMVQDRNSKRTSPRLSLQRTYMVEQHFSFLVSSLQQV